MIVKKFITVLMFCLISSSVFAQKIEGSFTCISKYITDGSGSKFKLVVNGSKMSTKDLEVSFGGSDYEEVFFSTKKNYSVFVQVGNNFERLLIIAPTENDNNIMITEYDTEDYYQKSVIAQGTCNRN